MKSIESEVFLLFAALKNVSSHEYVYKPLSERQKSVIYAEISRPKFCLVSRTLQSLKACANNIQ